ncbi:MAG: DUF5343 domain-containing protein [Candidatus Aegiribacteria sp.]|nr:DUF5343 domain-containing protein [Candidatus Aegiribacteria sp.]
MDFPILHDPGSIELLLSTVCKTDPPKLVDHDYLVSLGFKREVDDGLLKLLLFLGFIDENGQPSALWKKSLHPERAPQILRDSVKAAYGSLFKQFPNAYQEEGSVLMEFFRVETGDSDPNVAYMILTFKVLCDLAELSKVDPEEKTVESTKKAAAVKKPAKPKRKSESADKAKPTAPAGQHESPCITVSFNIDLADGSDPELRDLVMKLLKRQLEL